MESFDSLQRKSQCSKVTLSSQFLSHCFTNSYVMFSLFLLFWSSISRSHWLAYSPVPFLICQMWDTDITVWVSSKSMQINTCSERQCSSTERSFKKAQKAAKGTNGCPQCQLLVVCQYCPLQEAAASATSHGVTGRTLWLWWATCPGYQ